jgi:hypothetical protein
MDLGPLSSYTPQDQQRNNPLLDHIDQAFTAMHPLAQQAVANATPVIQQHNLALTGNPGTETGAGYPRTSEQPQTTTPGTQNIATAAPAPVQGHLTKLARPSPTDQFLSAAQQEQHRLVSSGSGASQIHNPFLRGLATVGDVASAFFPRISQTIPGTTMHHNLLVRQAGQNVNALEAQENEEQKRATEHAQQLNEESLPQLHQTQAELAAEKLSNSQLHNTALEDIARTRNENTASHNEASEQGHQAALEAALREHGYGPDGRPLPYDQLSDQMKSIHDLKAIQEEVASATADLKKAQATNQPTLMKMAQQRIDNAKANQSVALERLGLSEKQYEMRAHGTENNVPLPGSMTTEQGQPVGTALQGNVRPTGTQRDAAGRADTMLDLDARIRKALQNPIITNGTGPLAGRLSEAEGRLGTLPKDLSQLRNDLVSYGAFQAGLHPVRGIGALQYFDKVMGGLGQNPDELIGKLDSNKITAESVKRVGSPRTAGSNAAPQAQGPPKAGAVENGYRFKGGNPGDKANWEKVQ